MSAQHIVRSFDKELDYLAKKIAEMGKHARHMVERSISAIVQDDSFLADRVIAEDIVLDEAERDIDEKAILIIALRQPMAVDLREIVGTIRMSADLERIGDMGKNIAKRVAAMTEIRQSASFYKNLEAFASLALRQLDEVLDAYAKQSLERIDAVREHDDEIDAMYTSLFRELLSYMVEYPSNITVCTHLLFCAKNIERIGDHATNIAETVHYILTGYYPLSERPKDDQTYEVGLDKKRIFQKNV
ncbi:MAG: phosphate transport system protein [Candidatus Tokpelaia sp. JSC161]|jgi:phosphate transport system protein|nr:MAG: phosphate transport system protein [Candidatus Tokpelaia sp. JSC161]